MNVERVPHNGHLIVSGFVTDGVATWLHSETYVGYSEREARALYAASLRALKLGAGR